MKQLIFKFYFPFCQTLHTTLNMFKNPIFNSTPLFLLTKEGGWKEAGVKTY